MRIKALKIRLKNSKKMKTRKIIHKKKNKLTTITTIILSRNITTVAMKV